jgi:hypothetical protein
MQSNITSHEKPRGTALPSHRHSETRHLGRLRAEIMFEICYDIEAFSAQSHGHDDAARCVSMGRDMFLNECRVE